MFILSQRNLETSPGSHSNLCLKFPVRSECWTFRSTASLVTLSTSGARLPKVCSVLLTDNPASEISFDRLTSTLNRFLLKILVLGSHGF